MSEVRDRMRAIYDEQAGRYASFHVETPPPLRLLAAEFAALGALAGQVLDLGCGPGQDMAHLRGAGARVSGLDLSAGMLAEAATRNAGPLVQGDLCALPFGGSVFSGVWCNASFLHVPKSLAPAALTEMARVLRPGGVLMLAVKAGDGETWEISNKSVVERFFAKYSEAELRERLTEAGFGVREAREQHSPSGETWLRTLSVLG
ncbi:class I SAM-dependent DNA methyltransferase [Longispora albida]|uniref:class I SAM-dependent DNA methyltransferase n=1 Tax=Longispora albida TaxID=203523 RepID=UPI0003A5BE90|nr:class I SAM-dependent methyltransferase [Longispora albida]